jgi:hypothetical protein
MKEVALALKAKGVDVHKIFSNGQNALAMAFLLGFADELIGVRFEGEPAAEVPERS